MVGGAQTIKIVEPHPVMETLSQFTDKFKEERDFSSLEEASQCLSLIVSFLSSPSWQEESSSQDKLILYTCLRLLLRDSKLIDKFLMNGSCLCILSQELTGATHRYLNNTSCDPQDLLTTLVMELTNIIQKLAHNTSSPSSLLSYGTHKQLLFLLSSYNHQILQSSLNGLINMSKREDGRKAILNCYPLELLIHIMENGNSVLLSSVHASASDLFLLLSQDTDMHRQIKEHDLLSSCLNLVQSSSLGISVKRRLLESIERVLDDEDLIEEFKELGGIAVIMILITSVDMGQLPDCVAHQKMLMACFSLVTSLSLNDVCAKQIVDHNGIYLISHYLVTKDTDRQLQLYCIRALRYLFSLERNRRYFKRLFPLVIFEDFINIGHYIHNLSAYTKLVDAMSNLSSEDKATLKTNQMSLNQTNNSIRFIGDYTVLELLGTGAYGSVYKVRKGTHGNLFALKEIRGNHPALESSTTNQDQKDSVGRIMSEVAMIHEKLRHPNIVRYYKCFEESQYLYIEMGLIDGAPLSEFITSLKEKKIFFAEERIWHIFSQIIRALRYLHEDKRIVHRDLKPANMILGEYDKLTITDFGLAKHHEEFSVMKSVVGTIVYWCPELVENKEYDKKADIWAAGCVLYELVALQPAFYATNLLSLATKIAEGKFDQSPLEKCSPLITDVISACLTVEATKRADSIQIGSMMSDHIMRQFDQVVYKLESTMSAKPTLLTAEHWKEELDKVEDINQRTKRRLVFEAENFDTDSMVTPRDFSPMLTATRKVSLPTEQLIESKGISSKEPITILKQRSYSLSPVPSHRKSLSGSPLLRVSPQKLREIADPVSDLLQVVHKLIFIFQLNSFDKANQTSDPAYSIVNRYTRALFIDSSQFDVKELKNELWKLATSSKEEVRLLPSLPRLLPAAQSQCPHAPNTPDKSVSYEQLKIFIEEVLKKINYYQR